MTWGPGGWGIAARRLLLQRFCYARQEREYSLNLTYIKLCKHLTPAILRPMYPTPAHPAALKVAPVSHRIKD
jgi:hypothetical protein